MGVLTSYVHKTIRLTGGNDFLLSSLDDFKDNEKNYVTGLYSTYFYMSIFFLCWLLTIVAIKYTSFQVPSIYEKYIGFVLIISCVIALFSWIFTFIAENGVKNSLLQLNTNHDAIHDVFEIILKDLYLGNFLTLKNKNIETNNICETDLHSLNTTSETYPYLQVLTKIIDLENDFKYVEHFLRETNSIIIDGIHELSSRYSLWISLFYVFTSFTFVSTAGLITFISLSFNNYKIDLNDKNIARLLACTVIFIFATSMIASDSGVYALVGADFCTDNVNYHIKYISDQHSVQNNYISKIDTCEYSLFVNIKEKRDELHYYLNTNVYTFASSVSESCALSVNSTSNYLRFTDNLFDVLDEHLSCSETKKLYNDLIKNSLCNNLVANVCSLWMSLSTAIISSMAILSIFLLFDLESGNYDLLFY